MTPDMIVQLVRAITRPRVPFYRLIENRRARRSLILSKRWR